MHIQEPEIVVEELANLQVVPITAQNDVAFDRFGKIDSRALDRPAHDRDQIRRQAAQIAAGRNVLLQQLEERAQRRIGKLHAGLADTDAGNPRHAAWRGGTSRSIAARLARSATSRS